MRHTGPVTGKEVMLGESDEIISATDTKGVITFVNNTFCRVAKYSQDELIGQAHNLLRHPDMPAAAFQMLWDCIQAGKPWLGIVKNRCKDGDHYWVSAHVTPAMENGKVVGYESVRIKPSRESVARADTVYQRINAGKSPISPILAYWQNLQSYLFTFAITLLVGVLFAVIAFDIASSILPIFMASLTVTVPIGYLSNIRLKLAAKKAKEVVDDPLAAYIYTGRTDALGALLFSSIMQRQHIRTALSRFGESAKELRSKSEQVQAQSECCLQGMSAQQQETIVVANSIQQMAQAVQEVATSAANTSAATSSVVEEIQSGNDVLEGARNAINSMSDSISELAEVVTQLKDDSGKISSVVDVIRGIAEQTNLLALNAAIEAARAGEQGRGFAVVADEVRSLAQRTQESTQHIQDIIEALGRSTAIAAEGMDGCHSLVESSVEEVKNVGVALLNIGSSVNNINQLSQQIAAAAEQQSAVAKEIDRTTQTISDISKNTQRDAKNAADVSHELSDLAQRQFSLVDRFN